MLFKAPSNIHTSVDANFRISEHMRR